MQGSHETRIPDRAWSSNGADSVAYAPDMAPGPPAPRAARPLTSPSVRGPIPMAFTGENPGMAIQKVGVVGCGLMGSGIVQVAAQAGLDVRVREVDDAALAKGLARIDRFLA